MGPGLVVLAGQASKTEWGGHNLTGTRQQKDLHTCVHHDDDTMENLHT